MYILFITLLSALPLGTLVGAHRSFSRSRHRSISRRSTSQTYAIQDLYQGEDFFKYVSVVHVPRRAVTLSSEWTFFTEADPTGGNVNYVGMQDAMDQGLAYVDDCDNSTVLAVDSTSSVPAGGNRNS